MTALKAAIEIDGSEGEGGGQLLRTSLALSMCLGAPFAMKNIRAGRKKPGLLRQHLTAVNAAAQICGATSSRPEVGAMNLHFSPGALRGGNYEFNIGSAGSTTLVLQTILPGLLAADAPSTVTIRGGTHNPMAPTAHFVRDAFLPIIRRMGGCVELTLGRYGFAPAGGGEIAVSVRPSVLSPLQLLTPGPRESTSAEAIVAAVPASVGVRELDTVAASTGWPRAAMRLVELPSDQGPGNALLLTLRSASVTEVFDAIGEQGLRAEVLAERTARAALTYLASGAAVGPYLADQLLVPIALAGAGAFTTSDLTPHTISNAALIAAFIGRRFDITSNQGAWAVSLLS